MHFKCQQCDDGRKFLMKHSDIVAARATLLIKIYKMGYADGACVPYNIHLKLNKKELAEYELQFR